jgi:hypothetical protein
MIELLMGRMMRETESELPTKDCIIDRESDPN